MTTKRDEAILQTLVRSKNRGLKIAHIYKHAKKLKSDMTRIDVVLSLKKQVKRGKVLEENGMYKLVDKTKGQSKNKINPGFIVMF